MHFAARAEGESKLDQTVVFEFLVGLYDKWLGRIIPTRFALFGTVGAMGVFVQLGALWFLLHLVFGERFVYGHWTGETTFNVANTLAAIVAMTFNFVLNNELTYADKRLKGRAFWLGLLSLYAVCSIGTLANVSIASWIYVAEPNFYVAGFLGALMSMVFNYSVTRVFTWR